MRIAWLNWRDTTNPEGGGSEVYLERISQGLVERGHEVTVLCAEHERAPRDEVIHGVRYRRRGTKLSVYGEARSAIRRGVLGDLDVVIDTQNGVPFFAPFATRVPVVVLVHHVHREQWPVVYDPIRARLGWWLESRAAPRIYRRQHYVAVSAATREELIGLGVDETRISLVHNGIDAPPPLEGWHGDESQESPHPHVVVLGRLVPHKRVERALRATSTLRHVVPGLRVSIIGDGWWAPQLRDTARCLGIEDIVDFTGYVDDRRKDELLRSAWVLALPSLKEGWGLVVMEAAARGVPTVAYAEAGGVNESVLHGQTGVLVESSGQEDTDVTRFTEAIGGLLAARDGRREMGARARVRASEFEWSMSVEAFEDVLRRQASGTRTSRSSRRQRKAYPPSAALTSERR
jgi:glycosyltransferase involved in cell wall biosynthesis